MAIPNYTGGAWTPTVDWGDSFKKLYNHGLDRGMLYVDTVGTPWVGLTGIDFSPAGGGLEPRYLDGRLVTIAETPNEYSGRVTAFTKPDEFLPCLGTRVLNGLQIHNQPSKPFDLTYRRMANASDGTTGYEIIFVYGCRTQDGSRTDATTTDTTDIQSLSWDLTAVPVSIPGFRPTPVFTISTRSVSATKIASIERILYGAAGAAPRMPTISELTAYLAT